MPVDLADSPINTRRKLPYKAYLLWEFTPSEIGLLVLYTMYNYILYYFVLNRVCELCQINALDGGRRT